MKHEIAIGLHCRRREEGDNGEQILFRCVYLFTLIREEIVAMELGFDLRSAWLYREILARWFFPALILLRLAILRYRFGFGGWKLFAGAISTAGVSGLLISVLPVALVISLLLDHYLIGWFFGHRNPAFVTCTVTILVSSGLATLVDIVLLRWVFRSRIRRRELSILAATNAVAFVLAGYAMVDFIMKNPPEA